MFKYIKLSIIMVVHVLVCNRESSFEVIILSAAVQSSQFIAKGITILSTLLFYKDQRAKKARVFSHRLHDYLPNSFAQFDVQCTIFMQTCFSEMGPVRIRHSSHDFGWQSSHSVDLAGWQAKWLPLKFGYHDVMRTSPIWSND